MGNFKHHYHMSDYIPRKSYWGFSKKGDGALSLVLKGHGWVTVDFGNPTGDPMGTVTILLNGEIKSVAGIYTFSKKMRTSFDDGDWLEIREVGGVIVINAITIKCVDSSESKANQEKKLDTSDARSDGVDQVKGEGIDEVKKKWQHAYNKHQSDSLRVKRKQRVYDKASKLKNATLEAITNETDDKKASHGAKQKTIEEVHGM